MTLNNNVRIEKMKKESRLTLFTRRFALVIATGAVWIIVAPIVSVVQLLDSRDVIAAQQTVESPICVEYINLSVSSAWTFIIVGAIALAFAVCTHRALSLRNQTGETESEHHAGGYRR